MNLVKQFTRQILLEYEIARELDSVTDQIYNFELNDGDNFFYIVDPNKNKNYKEHDLHGLAFIIRKIRHEYGNN